jgi:hypothetical protein
MCGRTLARTLRLSNETNTPPSLAGSAAKRRAPSNGTLHVGAEDLVEAGDELRVAVAIRNLTSSSAPEGLRLRACWVTQRPSGFAVMPARCTRRVWATR